MSVSAAITAIRRNPAMPITAEAAAIPAAAVAEVTVPEEVLVEVPVEVTIVLTSRWVVVEEAAVVWPVSAEAELEAEVEAEMNVSNF